MARRKKSNTKMIWTIIIILITIFAIVIGIAALFMIFGSASKDGKLVDVTDGEVTGGLANGMAESSYDSSGYVLTVNMNNLPPPGDFCKGCRYEGWVIRRGVNMDVMSSGEAVLVSGNKYINSFQSSVDLTDHDFYVLTIEKNFGDGIPEDHILEGDIR